MPAEVMGKLVVTPGEKMTTWVEGAGGCYELFLWHAPYAQAPGRAAARSKGSVRREMRDCETKYSLPLICIYSQCQASAPLSFVGAMTYGIVLYLRSRVLLRCCIH